MRLLVTGGAGFIGSNFVRRVVDGSLTGIDRITVLDKLTYAGTLSNLEMLPKGSFEFIKGDIADPVLVDRLTKQNDAVVNFAAESHVDRSITGARDFIETNVLGTQNLLDASLRNEISTFVQVSTDEVYGTISEGS
jgi:dTDP-glucose 4,6-dehydratase